MSLVALLLQTLRLRSGSDALRRHWNACDPEDLLELVRYEGCELWLHRRLKELEVSFETPMGQQFSHELGADARRITATNLMIGARADLVVGELSRLGVPHVLLKGTARRLLADRIPLVASRRMVDVDVLVPAPRAREALDGLMAAGYVYQLPLDRTPEGHRHLPPLVARDGVPVELHVSTSAGLPARVAWRRAQSGTRAVNRSGVRVVVPSAMELMWHGVTHSLEAGDSVDGFRMRHFLDAASIITVDERIDWREIERRLHGDEVAPRDLAQRWLNAAGWLAGRPLPRALVGTGGPLPLGRMLNWRRRALVGGVPATAFRERLLEEGTRGELGWGITPGVPGTPLWKRFRRRSAALAARGAYRLWCAHGEGARIQLP